MKKSRDQKRRRDKNKHIVIDHGSGIKNPWSIFFTQKDIKNVPSKSLCVQGIMRNRREVRRFAKRLE